MGEVKEENFGDDYGEERQPGVAQAFRGVAQAGEEQGEGVEGPKECEAAGAWIICLMVALKTVV